MKKCLIFILYLISIFFVHLVPMVIKEQLKITPVRHIFIMA